MQLRDEHRRELLRELGHTVVDALADPRGQEREALQQALDVGIIAALGEQARRRGKCPGELAALVAQISELGFVVARLHQHTRPSGADAP